MSYYLRLQDDGEPLPLDSYEVARTAFEREQKKAAKRVATAGRVKTAYRQRKAVPRPCPNACEVCGSLPLKRPLHLDHDHGTDKFRGWLCHNCNLALGHTRDNPETLRKLANYLEEAESNRTSN